MNLLARRRPSRPANMPPWETARASFARLDKLKHVPRGVCFSLPRRATARPHFHGAFSRCRQLAVAAIPEVGESQSRTGTRDTSHTLSIFSLAICREFVEI